LPEGKTVDIVVKEFFPRGLNRLKTVYLPSKARKAWKGSVALMERDLPTPVPVAYLEIRSAFFVQESCFLTVLVEGVEEIRPLFRQLSPDKLKTLLRALARHMDRCHEEGILHRDLSDGNILVRNSAQDEPVFFLIDTNRIRLKKNLRILQRIKNLTRLGVPRAFQVYFLEQYTGTHGLKKWMWYWYRFSKLSYTGHIGMKKRLHLGRHSKSKDGM
jgi:serine/threonine protein kinase